MAHTYSIQHGGLLHCCLETINYAMLYAPKPPAEGDTLHCEHCADGDMIFENNTWKWNPIPIKVKEGG